eukprot:TRINITY_DN30719_c1_g2_i1.p1 TRINITY_DN30719_c1_g2~~TRINITY_DN30719_c1_g2_i1.p1  ORF type:complete len:1204 (-),score=195.44 TRINITY_DN30719_c1_g2_i1:22-3633(-)
MILPPQCRLVFSTEGCDDADLAPWHSVVEDAAAAAAESQWGRAWRWARSPSPPCSCGHRLEANVNALVASLANHLSELEACDTQQLVNGADAALRGVGVLVCASSEGGCASSDGGKDDGGGAFKAPADGGCVAAGELVGVLTRLRGSRYRASMTPTAAARMDVFAEPVWLEHASEDVGAGGACGARRTRGPAFDRWLHGGLRWLQRAAAGEGNVAIAPVVAVTQSFRDKTAERRVWLFAVAYTAREVAAGSAFALSALDAPSPPTSATDAPLPEDVIAFDGGFCGDCLDPGLDDLPDGDVNRNGRVMPLIDLQESQLMGDEAMEAAVASDPFLDGLERTLPAEAAASVPAPVGKSSRRARSTWSDVIRKLPCPVDWAERVRSQYVDVDRAVAQLNAASEPLRVGTPCAGFEAPIFALRGLGVDLLNHAFAVDIAPHASTFGQNLHRAMGGSGTGHRYGPETGDLMKQSLDSFPSVDLLIAGPPCPPWSCYGRRAGRDDPRAHVFWRTIELIGVLARRPEAESLKVFVLENVKGILGYDAHHRRGIDEVLERLHSTLQGEFAVVVLKVNTRDYSLPQNRPRVYIVGVRTALVVPGKSVADPSKHTPPNPQTLFPEWLAAWSATPSEFLSSPSRLAQKKAKWDRYLDGLDEGSSQRWLAANANIERDLDNRFQASARRDGLFGTITTGDRLWVWVRSVGDDRGDVIRTHTGRGSVRRRSDKDTKVRGSRRSHGGDGSAFAREGRGRGGGNGRRSGVRRHCNDSGRKGRGRSCSKIYRGDVVADGPSTYRGARACRDGGRGGKANGRAGRGRGSRGGRHDRESRHDRVGRGSRGRGRSRAIPSSQSDVGGVVRLPPAAEASQRYLMPIEALAMQGFPTRDPLLAAALEGLSDSEVLRGAGNAMSVPVVGAIFAELFTKTRICEVVASRTASHMLPPQPRQPTNASSRGQEILKQRSVAWQGEFLARRRPPPQPPPQLSRQPGLPQSVVAPLARLETCIAEGNETQELAGDRVEEPTVKKGRMQRTNRAQDGCWDKDSGEDESCEAFCGQPLEKADRVHQLQCAPRFGACGCWLHLVQLSGARRKTLHVRVDELQLGRDPRQIPPEGRICPDNRESGVSRRHAVLRVGGASRGVLVDLGSSNGTIVLGRGTVPVNESVESSRGQSGMQLLHGDVVAFGPGQEMPGPDFEFYFKVVFPDRRKSIGEFR